MIARAFLNSGVTSALILLCGVATGIIVARVLGAEDRGLLGVVIFWGQFLSAFAALSLADAVVVEFRRSKRRHEIAGQAYRISWKVIVFASLPGGAIIWMVLRPYGTEVLALALIFWVVQLVVLCLDQVAQGIIRSEHRFTALNYLRISVPVSYLAFIIVAAALGGGLGTFVAAHVGALIFALMVRLWLTRSWLLKGVKADSGGDLLRTAAGFHGIAVIGILAGQIDRLAIVQTSSPATIGFYLVAATVASPIQSFVAIAIRSIALPALVNIDERRRPAAALRLLQMTWVLSLLGAGAMAIAAPILVPILFGTEFAPAGALASALAIVGVLLPVREAITEILKSDGEARPSIIGGIVFVVGFTATFCVAWMLSAAWPVVWALGSANVAAAAYLALALGARMPDVRMRAWILPTCETGRELLALTVRSIRGPG